MSSVWLVLFCNLCAFFLVLPLWHTAAEKARSRLGRGQRTWEKAPRDIKTI